MKLLGESLEIIKAMELLIKNGGIDSGTKNFLVQNILAMKDL